MRNKLFLITVVLFLFACKQVERNEAFNRMVNKSPYTVLMFFAPDCPLCLTFSKPFNALIAEYPDVQFIAVQSGMHYDPKEIETYKEETDLQAKVFWDRDYKVAHQFDASVTPEFLLIDSSAEVHYRGLLDDRMKSLGVYKQHWDAYYLSDALQASMANATLPVKETEPIGCVLEY